VRTLRAYIIRELARVLALSWPALAVTYLLVEFLGRLDNFLSGKATLFTVAFYLAASAPQALLVTGPMSALLAAVVCVELLARNNELIALRACGVAPRSLLVPALGVALCLSLALAAMGEFVAPPANRAASLVWAAEVSKGGKRPSFAAGRIWYRGEGTVYAFRWAADDGRLLHGLSLWRLSPHFALSERLDARSARHLQGGLWELEGGLLLRHGPEGGLSVEPFTKRLLTLHESPADFAAGQRRPEEMSSLELYQFARRLNHEGYDASRFLVEAQAKVAFCLGAAVLVALGLSFSLRRRRAGMALAVGFSLLAAFLFWVTQALFTSLGRTGALPWWLAPWGADALFSAAAWRLWLRTTAL
jgi:lipopolysaccharide export system permease protein